MAKKREIINQIVVCGELVDFLRFEKKVSKTGKEYIKYTVRVETNKDTQEQYDIEFFEMKTDFNGGENANYKGLLTAYETYRSIATDGVGEQVRITGKLVKNAYVSNGEIVDKIVLQGKYITHKKEEDKDEYFETCAIFKGIIFVDKVINEDNKVIISSLVNEKKTSKVTKGHLVDIIADEPDTIAGVNEMFKEDMVIPVGAKLVDVIDTVFLPEEDTKELDKKKEIGFGTGLEDIRKYNEWVEKENERRKPLREEGLKVHKIEVKITGCTENISSDIIEEKEIPFLKDDINEMFDDIYSIQDDLNAEVQQYKIDNMNIPF